MAATWGRGIKPLRLAAIGWGQFGRACAAALHETPDLMWAGVVRRDPPLGVTLGEGMAGAPMASHPRDLEAVDAAPVCIPTEAVPGTVQELLQMHMPVVECAGFEGRSLGAHHERVAHLAKWNRVGAVLGASWNPRALPQLRRRFELLIGDLDRACQQIEGDPLYLAEPALELPVKDNAALESEDHGVVFEPLAEVVAEVVDGPHASLLLEARADEWAFCARTMCDVARAMASLPHQAWLCSPFGLSPLFEAEALVEHAVATQRRRL